MSWTGQATTRPMIDSAGGGVIWPRNPSELNLLKINGARQEL